MWKVPCHERGWDVSDGVHPIVTPLLTLSADVQSKFECASQRFGRVRVFHLDELYDDAREKYQSFLGLCRSSKRSSRDTNFVFLYPQFLVNHPDALAAVLHIASEQTLRFVVMDEAHLHVQHGESFRVECRAMVQVFFRPVFHPPPPRVCSVLSLFMSANIPQPYVPSLARLTTLRFPPAAIVRGSPAEFEQREIRMMQQVVNKNDYVKLGLEKVVDFFRESTEGKAVVFTNSKLRSFTYARALERKIDEAKLSAHVDIFHVHGSLLKTEKFWRIRLFCDPPDGNVVDANIRGLVGTNAVNVGIDDRLIEFVERFEFARDLLTAFRSRGVPLDCAAWRPS